MPPSNTRKKTEEGSPGGASASAALASDADSKDTRANRVHPDDPARSQGPGSFPVVCRGPGVKGLFPSYRSLGIPPPWRRSGGLCYVGINPRQGAAVSSPTPAKGALGRHARAGGAVGVSLELPAGADPGRHPQSGGASNPAGAAAGSPHSVDSAERTANRVAAVAAPHPAMRCAACAGRTWRWRSIAPRSSGDGTITHLFGSGEKISIA